MYILFLLIIAGIIVSVLNSVNSPAEKQRYQPEPPRRDTASDKNARQIKIDKSEAELTRADAYSEVEKPAKKRVAQMDNQVDDREVPPRKAGNLSFDRDSLLKGIILCEILQPPKSRRRQRLL